MQHWMQLEAESANIYRSIVVAAREWEFDGRLWKGDQLKKALHWQEREEPHGGWARRYSTESDFDAASKFIRASEAESDHPERREKIFLSYRRNDSPHAADRIYQRLAKAFGHEAIFYDIETIRTGEQFRRRIGAAISRCAVVLAIIGEHWRDPDSSGERRLDNPDDFVRFEIRRALSAGIDVIPVLVTEASMPNRDELPEDIRALCDYNAAELFPGRDFRESCNRLVQHIKTLMPKRSLLSKLGIREHWRSPIPDRQ
jgi:hypothetical protein